MKLLNRSIAGLGLMLALPAAAPAQSVTMADLAGTWIATSKSGLFADGGETDTLIIRPDSQFNWSGWYERKLVRFWHFTGDSLRFEPVPAYKITLEGQQLTLTNVGYIHEGHTRHTFVAKRIGASKPKKP